MQKRTSYVLGFLIILFFGSSIVVWADLGFCPIHSSEEVLTLGKSYSVPRNQVLLEIFLQDG